MKLFEKQWESSVAWSEQTVKGGIVYSVHFDISRGLRFSVKSGNISACTRGPIKCLMHVLEHEAVGMAKYCMLKERTRQLGIWQKL